jgi:hypothetical protein
MANSAYICLPAFLPRVISYSNLSYFAVFSALVAGCQQRPNPGSLLSIQGNLFSSTPINVTSPVASSTAVPSASSTNGLTLGAIVGAVIGGLVVLLTMLGCCIVFYGKRRRRQKLERAQARSSYNALNGSLPLGGHVETQWNKGTPGGWSQDETPTTAGGYGSDKHNFSPYASQYTSPVSARDMLNPKQIWEPHPPNMTTVPGEAKMREAFEMEKMRGLRVEERRLRDQQMHDQLMQDAAERGFTTAPIIKEPYNVRGKGNFL